MAKKTNYKNMKIKSTLILSILLTLILTFSGCAVARSTYYPHTSLATNKKSENQVEYYAQKPQKNAIRTGAMSVNGNGFSSWDTVIKEAKRKAAEIGADYILLENSGVETQTITTPGYSNYQARGSSSAYGHGSPYSSSLNAYGNYQSSAYSYGPSQNTYHFPWANFSTWVYTPCHAGIVFENYNVTGFRLNSNAEQAGIKIGDTLLGIDGYELEDPELVTHLMNIKPNDTINLVLLRESKRVQCSVTAFKN